MHSLLQLLTVKYIENNSYPTSFIESVVSISRGLIPCCKQSINNQSEKNKALAMIEKIKRHLITLKKMMLNYCLNIGLNTTKKIRKNSLFSINNVSYRALVAQNVACYKPLYINTLFIIKRQRDNIY